MTRGETKIARWRHSPLRDLLSLSQPPHLVPVSRDAVSLRWYGQDLGALTELCRPKEGAT
jgi:hypothetical protein